MSKPTRLMKPDPIFVAIDAHRLATATRYPIQEKMCSTRDGTAKHTALWITHDKALSVEVKATLKLRKIQPTTVAGVMAVTAYFAEHMDRYPGCGWMGGEAAYDDPCWFGDGLIRNIASAMAKIDPAPVA